MRNCKITSLLLLLITEFLYRGLVVIAGRSCPCDDEALCEPIGGPPVRDKEIFGFARASGSDGLGLNWTHITTIAWAKDDKLICRAHQHGVRAILASPPFDLEHDMVIPERRAEWIQDTLQLVRDKFADGVVFDNESPQPVGSLAGLAYAKLIAETREVFQSINPSYQISTCVPWSPDSIDGRNFPWVELAKASDLLYVMDYDTRSQIFDACIAGANAPFSGMVQGMGRFFDLGIDPGKLVLGVPWYGFRYPCLPGTSPDTVYCPIKKVPFRGVNCSDAAGIEISYAGILRTLHSTDPTVTGGLRRDENMDAPFFNAVFNDTVYQYWFDDAASLSHKFRWAKEHKLRGVGPYTFSFLDVEGRDADIWSTFDVFVGDELYEWNVREQR